MPTSQQYIHTQIQKERKAFNVTEKKPCIIEISEKGFSLHDNTDSMEVSSCSNGVCDVSCDCIGSLENH